MHDSIYFTTWSGNEAACCNRCVLFALLTVSDEVNREGGFLSFPNTFPPPPPPPPPQNSKSFLFLFCFDAQQISWHLLYSDSVPPHSYHWLGVCTCAQHSHSLLGPQNTCYWYRLPIFPPVYILAEHRPQIVIFYAISYSTYV